MNNAAMNMAVQISGSLLSILLDIYPKGGLLEVVILCLIFCKNTRQLSTAAAHLTFPPAAHRGSNFSTTVRWSFILSPLSAVETSFSVTGLKSILKYGVTKEKYSDKCQSKVQLENSTGLRKDQVI